MKGTSSIHHISFARLVQSVHCLPNIFHRLLDLLNQFPTCVIVMCCPHIAEAPAADSDVSAVGVSGVDIDTYGNSWTLSADGRRVFVSSQREPPLKFLAAEDVANWRLSEDA